MQCLELLAECPIHLFRGIAAEYQLNKDMLYRFVECFDSFAGKQEAFDLVVSGSHTAPCSSH